MNTTYGLSGTGSWTLDVWGKIRRQVESAADQAQASAADLAAARLSAQSTLATDYFLLRSSDELERLLEATTTDYQRALTITENELKAGVVSRADVVQAQNQVDSVRAQTIAVGIQRAL